MSDDDIRPGLAAAIEGTLPALRRHARALTGSQARGDRYAIAALQRIADAPHLFDRSLPPKLELFRVFHRELASVDLQLPADDVGLSLHEARAQWRLRGLHPLAREALLLRSVECFRPDEIAVILGLSEAEAEGLIEQARDDMGEMIRGRVLIIEDEVVIAMDLQSLVESMGHSVTGVAGTCAQALELGRSPAPDLILSDIQLADKSSGIDAVSTLLSELGLRPVIFVTAFPDKLLTGQRPEPAFLISKPYSEDEVRAAVSQAMFFATAEAINAHAA